ncbi:MAG: sulfatase-like hydrolase/transferase [Alphaproteobacteria bacterium]
MSQQPNIIIVLVDRVRRDALGFMGDANVRTPNLDAMARQGIFFTAASSTSPNSVPFRFSFMTGEYAHSRNVPALGYRLSPAEYTIGEAMAAQGYATAYVGKWHLYGQYGVTGTQTAMQAALTPVPARSRRGFEYWRGFDIGSAAHGCHYFAGDDPTPLCLSGAQTDGLFDLAIDYVAKDRPKDRPFFTILSLESPNPLTAAPDTGQGALRPRDNMDLSGIRFLPPQWRGNLEAPHGRDGPQALAATVAASTQAYYAMIENIDANLGRLQRRLVDDDLDQSTLILFLANHGEMAGSHGMFGAGEPFEESVGVPLIGFSANPVLIKGNRQSALPICTQDLYPILIGLGGGVPPVRPGRCDLSGFFRGTASEPERDAVLLEFVAEVRPTRRYYRQTWRGIRTRHHKYTVLGTGSGGMPWQLFDMVADPLEQDNLILEAAHVRLAETLHEDLRRLLIETEDDYPLAPFAGDI